MVHVAVKGLVCVDAIVLEVHGLAPSNSISNGLVYSYVNVFNAP